MNLKVFLNSAAAIERHLLRDYAVECFECGEVIIVMCDRRGEVLMHTHLDLQPVDLGPGERAMAVSAFVERFPECHDGSILVVLVRRGPVEATPSDTRWFWTARRVCEESKVRLLGVHVLTPGGVREVVLDDAL